MEMNNSKCIRVSRFFFLSHASILYIVSKRVLRFLTYSVPSKQHFLQKIFRKLNTFYSHKPLICSSGAKFSSSVSSTTFHFLFPPLHLALAMRNELALLEDLKHRLICMNSIFVSLLPGKCHRSKVFLPPLPRRSL
ncbi:hypothetical protein CDAR_295481 [Caerostris darwini]|uniref:Maturase K n=1 Tax=Caerostris darwini TaxID=1538125 RepID=A0AAV4NGQ1_9ARAC|nr:hypothetical protein CDAR_295481 [Caerostris darwini]